MSEITDGIRDIGFFKALLTEIKLSFKGSELQNEIVFLSKVLSVGIYLDKKITTLELDKAKDITIDEMGEEWGITWDNVLVYLKKYRNVEEKWLFSKNKDYVLEKIISESRYSYAKYFIEVLEADNIKDEERDFFERLSAFVKKHEELLSAKGLA